MEEPTPDYPRSKAASITPTALIYRAGSESLVHQLCMPGNCALRWNTQYRGRSQNRPSAWSDAARIAGHYFNSTVEDPPRIRVDAFPTAEELAELQTLTV